VAVVSLGHVHCQLSKYWGDRIVAGYVRDEMELDLSSTPPTFHNNLHRLARTSPPSFSSSACDRTRYSVWRLHRAFELESGFAIKRPGGLWVYWG
jgi:hypothetical protein